jgi:hypothetical protein
VTGRGRRRAEIVLERHRGKRREGTTMVAVHGRFERKRVFVDCSENFEK